MDKNVMKKIRWALLAVNLAALALLFFLYRERVALMKPPAPSLPVLGAAPDFALTERSGRHVSSSDLRGGVWLADFIFTRCQGQCPLLSAKMAALQKDLKSLRLVSFSVDPEFDTPEVLSAYAASYQADPERWLFLTGDKDKIKKVIENFRLGGSDDPAFHNLYFVLVDAQGKVRGYYDSEEKETLARIKRDATLLQKGF